MRRTPLLAAALVASLASAGCGSAAPPPISFSCTDSRAVLARALERAPGAVRLRDGSRLSQCVTDAQGEGELQDFGVLATQLADDLAGRAARDPHAAVELGYLVGAARRGAATTAGLQAELVHRLEASARQLDAGAAAVQGAYQRGLVAGERTG